MGPASEQADAGQVIDVARSTVTDPAVPEDHVPGAGGERVGRMGRGVGENAPAPFLKGLRLTEGAFDLIGVFEKIPVGGVVAARPVDKGTTPLFHVVQVGGGAHHQHRLAAFAGIAVDVARLRYSPIPALFRPADDHATAAALETVAPQLSADGPHLLQIAEQGIWFESAGLVGPALRFVRTATHVAPELIPPRSEEVSVDYIGQDQVAVGLESVDLSRAERRRRHGFTGLSLWWKRSRDEVNGQKVI